MGYVEYLYMKSSGDEDDDDDNGIEIQRPESSLYIVASDPFLVTMT